MKKRIFTIITVIMVGVIMSACNTDTPKKIKNDVKNDVKEDAIDKEIEKKSLPNKENQVSNEKALRGELISNALVMEEGIEDASVAVIGNEAIVAVVLSDNEKLSEGRKESIKRIVNSFDDSIRKAYITENKEIFFGIDEIAQAVMKKNDDEAIRSSFESIKSKLNPEDI